MSEINYRQQWGGGEIEAGTLLDAIDALAQRCREMEHMLKHARMDADAHYADALTLRAEVEQLQARLRRIESIAECGSVQSWLALPDEAKAKWFGLHAEQDSERLRLRAEVERLRQPAARYEHLRRLDPNQFGNLWQKNIQTGKPFDTLVDEGMEKKQ